MQGKNANLILDYLKDHPLSSSKSIHNALSEKVAYATVNAFYRAFPLRESSFLKEMTYISNT
jgi:hypothetical protein